MNRIYRLVFNRSLGVMQAVSEIATQSHGGVSTAGTPAQPRRRLLAFCVGAALLVAASSAFAVDNTTPSSGGGGLGGAGSGTSGGGHGGGYPYSNVTGANGLNGVGSTGLSNGDGVGGDGGEAGFVANQAVPLPSQVTGLDGGAGSISAGGGGGGGGGGGIYTQITDPSVGGFFLGQGAMVKGGNGGDGGNGSPTVLVYGGGGGGGGTALVLGQNVEMNSYASLIGGNGGVGGYLAAGGGGGTGVLLSGNAELFNYGSVVGGDGGVGDNQSNPGHGGVGVVITGDNNFLSNQGSVEGGWTGNRFTQAQAVVVEGNDNIVRFGNNSSTSGDVAATGTGNTLQVEGTGTTSTYVSGFDNFRAFDGAQWSLNGLMTANTSITFLTGNDVHVTIGGPLVLSSEIFGLAPRANAGITVYGNGTLELMHPMYTGTTVLGGGTLILHNAPMAAYQVDNGTLDGAGESIGMTSLMGQGGQIRNVSELMLDSTALISTYAGNIDVGTFATTEGSLFVSTGTVTADDVKVGGLLQLGNGSTGGTLNGNASGPGTLSFNHSDDTVYEGDASVGLISQVGSGTLTLTGNNSAPLIDIDNGTLRAGSEGSLGHAIVSVFDGTTFAFGGNQTFANTFVLRGQGTFDVADGTTGTLTGQLADGTSRLTRMSSSGGSVVKTGGGTLVLDTELEVTGQTEVQAGTLVVGSAAGSGKVDGDVLADAGTTVGGAGTIAGGLGVIGGTVAPGMAQIGVLNVGRLGLTDAHLAIDLGTPGTGDRIDVAGDVDIARSVIDVNDLGGMGLGVYRVLDFGGTLYGSDLTLGSTPGGQKLALRYVADDKAFDIVNLGDLTLSYWNADGKASSTHAGGGSGTWSATSRTFSDAEGQFTDVMTPQPGFAVFGGAAGNVTIDGSQGDVGVLGMQFMTDGYTVSGDTLHLEGSDGQATTIRVGDGSTAGAAMTATIASELKGQNGLRKTDAGTLVLTGDNTWMGGVAVEGGTLSVSHDANLGDGSNDVTLDGGALRATASFDTQRNVLLGGKGGTIATDGTLALHGTLSGKGSLHKSGNGTLGLYAASDYAAGTWLDAGTLQIANGAALGTGTLTMAEGTTLGLLTDGMNLANDIVAAGDPTIDVVDGTSSTLSGTIADGALPGDLVKTGTGTLRLTGENTYTGGTTIAAGTLIVGDGATHGSIRGDVVNDGTLAFDRSDDVTFNGAISGSGTIAKLGGNTLTLGGDSSAFTGDTQIEGGTLDLTGSLGGTLNIAQGATLTGAGKLGTVAIVSGSTMTPGGDAAIGTFDVAGNLDIANGSTYVVNTASTGESDTVNVAGTATIDGAAVRTLQDGGTYRASTRYTILTADGGVNGTFGSLTSNLAFLTPALAYDADHVYLDLQRNDIRFVDLATTRNQAATAVAVESQGAGVPVYDAVVTLTAAAVPPALDDLSGSSLASARAALIDDARQVRDTVQRHLLAADAAGAPADGVWTSAWGHWGDRDASGGVARLRSNGGGMLVGADRDLGGVSIGVLGGAGNLTARSGNDSVQSKSTIAGLYAGGSAGAWQWQVGATYAWDRLDSHRHVNVAGLPGTASARYDANVAQAYVDGGYRFTVGKGSLTPFVNVARVQVSQDGLTERNSDAALQVRGEDDGVTVGTAGLRGAVALGNAVSAHATVGYQHAWGDVRPYDTQRFVSGGDSFTVAGVPVAKDAGLLDAGLAFAIGRNATVDASYHGLFGGGAKDQGARLALNVKW